MEEQRLEHTSPSCETPLFALDTTVTNGYRYKLETVITPFHDINIFMEKQNLKHGLEGLCFMCFHALCQYNSEYSLSSAIKSQTQILIQQSVTLLLLFHGILEIFLTPGSVFHNPSIPSPTSTNTQKLDDSMNWILMYVLLEFFFIFPCLSCISLYQIFSLFFNILFLTMSHHHGCLNITEHE